MRWTRRGWWLIPALVLTTALTTMAGPAGSQGQATEGAAVDYAVLLSEGASPASAALALEALGGELVQVNDAVGLVVVRSSVVGFAPRAGQLPAVAGVARNRPIGEAPAPLGRRDDPADVHDQDLAPRADTDALPASAAATTPPAPTAALVEPLTNRQWDLAAIHSGAAGSYGVQLGQRGVRVGIIDTGVDGSHPDIAPNFDAALSRNFTTDIPLVDGPCEDEPDRSCNEIGRASCRERVCLAV